MGFYIHLERFSRYKSICINYFLNRVWVQCGSFCQTNSHLSTLTCFKKGVMYKRQKGFTFASTCKYVCFLILKINFCPNRSSALIRKLPATNALFYNLLVNKHIMALQIIVFIIHCIYVVYACSWLVTLDILRMWEPRPFSCRGHAHWPVPPPSPHYHYPL